MHSNLSDSSGKTSSVLGVPALNSRCVVHDLLTDEKIKTVL